VGRYPIGGGRVILYAIDPGVHSCALAQFTDRTLVGLTDTATWKWGPIGPVSIVLEVPRADKDPRKSNDLIDLNGSGGRLAGQIEGYAAGRATLALRYARNSSAGKGWKGQIPKPIHHARLIRTLSPVEIAIVEAEYVARRGDPKTALEYVRRSCARLATDPDWHSWYKNKIHNGLDAVALGATEIGRL
jgi:hypothetical protein